MTTRFQKALGFPKPPKREAKPPKRIKRHVRIAKVSAKNGQTSKADSEWSAMVKARAGGFCERTGSQGTDAHHVFGKRAHPRLRYDPDNGIWLTRVQHDKAHAGPKAFRAWFAVTFPHAWARLQEKARREARLS